MKSSTMKAASEYTPSVKEWPEDPRVRTYTEEENTLYKELAKRLSDQHKWPESKTLAEIYKMVATPDQVRVLLELPAPAEEIAQKLGLDKKFVEDTTQDQFEKGVIVPTRKGQWFNMRQVWQYKDATLPVTMYQEEPWWNDHCDIWNKLYEEYFRPLTRDAALREKVQRFRILPHPKAFDGIEGVTEYDDIREILKKAELIAVLPCACKRKERERPCGAPELVCININRTALYNLNKGPGRKLTVEEALEVHEKAMDWGMVMSPVNQKTIHNLICNCHVCTCCDFFGTQCRYGVPMQDVCAPSRFRTVVDPEKCQSCQKCVETCPFGAAKMIQYPGETHPRHPLGLPKWKGSADPEVCMGCGLCVVKCPHGARKLELVRPLDFIPDVAPAYDVG